MDTQVFSRRLYVPIVGVFLVVVLCLIKLFYVQIIHGSLYEELGDRQYITNTSQVFERGNIYVTQKDGTKVSAATLRNGFKVALQPKLIKDPHQVYEALAPYLSITQDEFMALLEKKSTSNYVEIANNLPAEAGDVLAPLKLPGIQLYRVRWRFYPAENLAAHAIGFMAFKGDDFIGRYGLERIYQEVLARTDKRLYVNFFAEVFSDISELVNNPEEKEGDLITTLEPNVQKNLQETLHTVQTTWNSDRVGGIIMNPQTGEIYAMGLDNEFNLNETRSVKDISQFNNPLVENVLEMGSIMKPIIASIALDQNVITPETTYFDQGFVKVGDRTIYNFDKRGRGKATMQTVLDQSLNTGMVFIMQRMKKADFKEQWKSFGFGEKTGIDLPAEATGLISNINTNRDVEYANISFGQGVATTPIAMIRALSVLANKEGVLVTPHLGKTLEYSSGLTKDLPWAMGAEPLLLPETRKTITNMLIHVYDHYGEGKYKLDHYAIAAKTGTAQIAQPGGGYYQDRNMHTFMAYFPAYQPKFIVFLFNENPKNGAQYSSQTLLPPFTELAKFLINYYDIPPDR